MFAITKTIARFALASTVLVGSIAAASANQPNAAVVAAPQPAPIAVPAPVPAYNFAGYWQINQYLYGPYYVSFSLNQYGGGSYTVSGGGLYCNGNLSWWQNGSSATVQLQYSYCGNGVGWSADYFTLYMNSYNSASGTYYPDAYGYSPVSIYATKY